MEITLQDKAKFNGVIARQDKKGQWLYILQRSDRADVVIRKSYRKYERAFLYSHPVTSGNKSGYALHFTFGKNPSPNYKDLLLEQYAVAFLSD
ncbi:MAG: hypothetical protein M0Q95_17905 [Porticoccaceae bacterium]|nr:hypothetical protein [Porticoccaceae bacterium]